MKQETISVYKSKSSRVELGGIIISLRDSSSSECEVVLGHPGLPNVVQTMKNGDAALYETTQDGIIEVRAIGLYPSQAEFLVTQVSPRVGLLAGVTNGDPNNAPFTEKELAQVTQSVADIKQELSRRADIAHEQLELINRKLDEIQDAAGRMGRKDWINYVAGTLTSICISAAFSSDVRAAIFRAANSAFSWLFANGPLGLLGM